MIDASVGTLGDLAYEDMVGIAKLDSTVIQGGYIKTSLIETGAIYIGYSNVTGTKPPSDADKTSSNTAYDTAR